MISYQPLSQLAVVGVRYRGSRLAKGDERSLNAYAASNVYSTVQIPFSVVEPHFPEEKRSANEPENLGMIGGEIADAVATGVRVGQSVLMSGGDCSHITGVIGGLQDACGATARIGLVWFDADGDFNTPKTTISGMLGGMPVAVSAGLGYPNWRLGSHIAAPLPTERIVMVDVRNLDPLEKQLIDATAVVIASPAAGFPGADLAESITQLSERCDLIYLHIDSDILDAAFVPNHGTREPNGPDIEQVLAAVETVMATGKVAAFAVVSVYGEGEGSGRSVQSGIELIRGGLESWKRNGMGCQRMRGAN